MLLLVLFFAAALAVPTAQAQERVELGGTVQVRWSYGVQPLPGEEEAQRRLGFGLRRARLRATAQLTDHAGAYLQLDAGGAAVSLLDAYAFYERSPWRVQAGRFAVAQPRANQLTSHTRIDAIERPVIAREWEDRTLGHDGRDFGIEAQYAGRALVLRLALHNGNGSWDRDLGNYRAGIDNPTGGADRTGMAVSLYGAYEPAALAGLEVGGYVGYNGAHNPNTAIEGGPFEGAARTYLSYAAHVYWGARPGSRPLRLKADFIGISYDELFADPTFTPTVGSHQEAYGVSLLGAARVHRAGELFARVEYFDPYTRASDDDAYYLTAGGSFSLSALRGQPYRRQRLTVGYQTRRTDTAEAPHLLVVQLQLVF